MDFSRSKGMTLMELIVVLAITGFIITTVSSLLLTSVSLNGDQAVRTSSQSEIRYFKKILGNDFHSATKDNASIETTNTTNDTFRFTSFFSNYSVHGLYTQIEYKPSNGNLIRTTWPAKYVGGVLTPANPWGSGGTIQTVLPDLDKVYFQWMNHPFYFFYYIPSTACINVLAVQCKTLSNGNKYWSETSDNFSFNIVSYNRLRRKWFVW
jgi:prepilin-type N-terminal cleavage/methylation domain-containing protein